MKSKKHLYFYAILAILLFGMIFPLSAQTGKIQNFQDSTAFRQWVSEQQLKANRLKTKAAAPFTTDSFMMSGNTSTFYPVYFSYNSWSPNEAKFLHLVSSRFTAGNGSLLAVFRYKESTFASGGFIDADIRQYDQNFTLVPFVAGWRDVAIAFPGSASVIIWLRGGTTYYYNSDDWLPFPFYTPFWVGSFYCSEKTTVDSYVNSFGPTLSKDLRVGNSVYATTVQAYTVNATGTVHAGAVNAAGEVKADEVNVAGIVHAREVKVEANAGADFVFEDNYELMNLDDLDNFVKDNKHLPGIAPAASMEQNGVNMGEFQIKLLQKIEELTLYIIEQNKKMEILENEIKILKTDDYENKN